MADQPEGRDAHDPERVARDLLDQRTLHKTLTWLAEKQQRGLSESDIRTTLARVRLPNGQVVHQPGTGPAAISVGDNDPTDPIRGADQDPRDPFMWRSDVDPTDPPRRAG